MELVSIPSLPSRIDKLTKLYDKINYQSLNYNGKVEVICLLDNKSMTVGKKRKNLFLLSTGLYVCQIDDDDDISDDFVSTLITIIEKIIDMNQFPEVLSYDQECNIDGKRIFVVSSIKYPTTDSMKIDDVMYRFPWHWCCWRNDIAKNGKFYNCNGIEDSIFSESLKNMINLELKINKIMCYYNFNTNLTESPQTKLSKEEINNIEIL